MKKSFIILGAILISSCLAINYLAIGETANLPNGKAYVNCGGWLNLRQSPTKKAKVLAKLYKNDEINIIGRQGEWYQINSPKNGWVMAEFISGDSPGEPEPEVKLTPEEQVKVGRDMFMSADNAELSNVP